jgi:hypothetical protein
MPEPHSPGPEAFLLVSVRTAACVAALFIAVLSYGGKSVALHARNVWFTDLGGQALVAETQAVVAKVFVIMTKAIVSAAIGVIAKLVVITEQAIPVTALIDTLARTFAGAIAGQSLGWIVGHHTFSTRALMSASLCSS